MGREKVEQVLEWLKAASMHADRAFEQLSSGKNTEARESAQNAKDYLIFVLRQLKT